MARSGGTSARSANRIESALVADRRLDAARQFQWYTFYGCGANGSESGTVGTKPRSKVREMPENTKQCPYCKEEIRDEAVICKYCRSHILPDKPSHKGTCPFCKESIHPEATKCKHCGSFVGPEAPIDVASNLGAWTYRPQTSCKHYDEEPVFRIGGKWYCFTGDVCTTYHSSGGTIYFAGVSAPCDFWSPWQYS